MILAQTTQPVTLPPGWPEVILALASSGVLIALTKPLWALLNALVAVLRVKVESATKAHADADAAILARYDALQQQVTAMSTKLGSMEAELAQVKQERDALRQEVEALRAEVKELRGGGLVIT